MTGVKFKKTLMKQVLLTIYGRVQGVFFRAATQDKARKLGLTGWVRNSSDGAVNICAQGNPAALTQFIEWCSRGPASAKVTKIEKTWQEPNHAFHGFQIRY